ncbi:peptidase family M49-domain-containing protein [Cercophora samala]|uniref:Peptidase family M49-domain-containing protein n=1 Tax=Cercophora samala TaxID=330535 RepID=A0AA39YVE2_9PEZI|nr:peptidase family M49-domain-containing protein [Cercophora samala]
MTQQHVSSWYKGNETVANIFGSLGLTLDESRADGIGHFLLSDKTVLAAFGYNENSECKPEDCELVLLSFLTSVAVAYLSISVRGLEAFLSYDPEKKEWSQAHEHDYFIILCALLLAPDFIQLDVDLARHYLKIRIHRDYILARGRQTLADFLLKLHLWRVTANVAAFGSFLDEVSAVDDYWMGIRGIVQARKIGSWMFVQGNSFLSKDDRDVVYREYEESPKGLTKSWVERVDDTFLYIYFHAHRCGLSVYRNLV